MQPCEVRQRYTGAKYSLNVKSSQEKARPLYPPSPPSILRPSLRSRAITRFFAYLLLPSAPASLADIVNCDHVYKPTDRPREPPVE